MTLRTFVRGCATGAAAWLALSAAAAAAQGTYPSKPVRMILAFAPGSPSDIVGRALAQKLGEQLGENVVVENRVGAGGNLGVAAAARSAPDGYTLLLSSPAIVLGPLLYANPGFDPAKDFTPVARIASVPNVVLVHPSVPAKTLRQFISLARAQPGKLSYGSGGAGTTNHLANELLKTLENINLLHVPYKGASLAILALIGGEVDEVIVGVAPAVPYIRSGKVRPLAVMSDTRVPAVPDVPTSKEAGVNDFVMSTWYGLLVPAGTPREIVARLHRDTVRIMEAPDLRARLDAAGVYPWLGTADDLSALLRSESARFSTIIRRSGAKAD